jgi:hypothetical protein
MPPGELRKELAALGTLPDRVFVDTAAGDAFPQLSGLVKRLQLDRQRMAPAFVFVDPYGFEVPGRLLADLMAAGRAELFIDVIWRELDMAVQQQPPEGAGSASNEHCPHPIEVAQAALTEAQFVIARAYQASGWPRLEAAVRLATAIWMDDLEVTAASRWEEWVCYVLGLVERTSVWTSGKVRAIRELQQRTATLVRDRAPRIYSRELVDLVFQQPYCRISNVVEAGLAKRQTASTYLATLGALGILVPLQAGRERLFIHRALLELLATEVPDDTTPTGSPPAPSTPPQGASTQ